jgi:putative flippase GtrA
MMRTGLSKDKVGHEANRRNVNHQYDGNTLTVSERYFAGQGEIMSAGSGLVKNELLRNIIFYGFIGAFSAAVDALLFRFLVYTLDINALVANCFTVPVGITISFILNRRFNFKVMDRTLRRYAMFFSVGLCGLGISELMLYGGELLHLDAFGVKLVSVVVVALFQFTLNKLISFRVVKKKVSEGAIDE